MLNTPMPDGTKRLIHLSPDWSAGPLWSGGLTEPAQLGVSPALASALDQWQAFFDTHCHWDRGWDDPDREREFTDRGAELRDWLVDEVGTFATVVLDV